MSPLRLAGIVRQSIVDGPGLRLVVFTQGCPHHCPGCHNPETLDFDGGYLCDIPKITVELDKNPLLQGVTFSGGEPFAQARALLPLAGAVKSRALNLWCYSGYTYEALLGAGKSDKAIAALLSMLDGLVDGPFLLARRDLTLPFRGSANQRIIDVQQSLRCGRVVEIDIGE